MTPHILRNINPADAKLFEQIRVSVCVLPDVDLGKNEGEKKIILSCHILARAVGRVFGLNVKDGSYGVAFNHSWNELPESGHIVDTYPVGVLGGPILIDRIVRMGVQNLYVEDPPEASRNFGCDFKALSFLRAVKIVEGELWRIRRVLLHASSSTPVKAI